MSPGAPRERKATNAGICPSPCPHMVTMKRSTKAKARIDVRALYIETEFSAVQRCGLLVFLGLLFRWSQALEAF